MTFVPHMAEPHLPPLPCDPCIPWLKFSHRIYIETDIEANGVSITYRAGDFAYLRKGERQQYTVKERVKHLYVCHPGDWKAGA